MKMRWQCLRFEDGNATKVFSYMLLAIDKSQLGYASLEGEYPSNGPLQLQNS